MSGRVDIHLTYGYNYALCCHLYLEETEDGYVNMINDYGEVMFSACTGTDVAARIIELENYEY